MAGVTPSGYNGTVTVTKVLSGTSFQYTAASSGLAAGSGGTVSYVPEVGVESAPNSLNPVDEMVHPADVGNVAEGYPGLSGNTVTLAAAGGATGSRVAPSR